MRIRILHKVWFALAVVAAQPALAEPTEVVVRVIAKDAKFIGDETGGAKVVLRDAASGKVLAEGLTAGATGNTQRIMKDAHTRGAAVSDDGAAKFRATLDLDRPRLITATATGPMNAKEGAVTVSSTQWVIPGKPVNGGDGWLLELPGFLIELLKPLPTSVKLTGGPQKIPVQVKITMQCGCPITPGGQWDANKLELGMILHRGKTSLPAVPLTYAGSPSTFTGEIEIAQAGDYAIDFYAYAPWDGNTGVRSVSLRAR